MNDIDEDKILKESVRKNIDEKEQREKEPFMGNIKNAEDEIGHINEINDKADNISFAPWLNYEIVEKGKRADIIQNKDNPHFLRIREKVDGRQLHIMHYTEKSIEKDFKEIENNTDSV